MPNLSFLKLRSRSETAAWLSGVAPLRLAARALIDDGRKRHLCSPLDVGHYEASIERLIASPGLRRLLGAAAKKASEAYTWDVAFASAERAYKLETGCS